MPRWGWRGTRENSLRSHPPPAPPLQGGECAAPPARARGPARRRRRPRGPGGGYCAGWRTFRRARDASPPRLPARGGWSPGSRDRSRRPALAVHGPPFAEQSVDIALDGLRAEADPDHLARRVLVPAHRGEDGAGLEAARRAGASRRDGDAGEIELHHLRRAGDARHPVAGDGGDARRRIGDDLAARRADAVVELPPEP